MAMSAVLFTAAVALIAAQAPPGPRPDPLVRAGTTQKVSDHVSVIPYNSVPLVPNVGIIAGTAGVMVIDTGMGVRNGQTVLREAQALAGSKPIAYLATTHVHPEHDLGAAAFPASTKLIRAQSQIDEIATDGLRVADQFRSMSPLNAELLEDAQFRKADITFTDKYDVDLGGVNVHLQAVGFNHTKGDTVFFVDPDAILFSGDTAMMRLPNITGQKERAQHWLSTLDILEAMKPTVIVPSHGPTGDVAFISAYRTYLRGI